MSAMSGTIPWSATAEAVVLERREYAGGVGATIQMAHAHGLHTRPSAHLVGALRREAKLSAYLEFECRGWVASMWTSRASPTALIRLRARQGDVVRVRAYGPDAGKALDIVTWVLQQGTSTHEDAFTPEVDEALLEEFGSWEAIREWALSGMR